MIKITKTQSCNNFNIISIEETNTETDEYNNCLEF